MTAPALLATVTPRAALDACTTASDAEHGELIKAFGAFLEGRGDASDVQPADLEAALVLLHASLAKNEADRDRFERLAGLLVAMQEADGAPVLTWPELLALTVEASRHLEPTTPEAARAERRQIMAIMCNWMASRPVKFPTEQAQDEQQT